MSKLTKELLYEVQEADKLRASLREQKIINPDTSYQYGYWTGYRDAFSKAIKYSQKGWLALHPGP